MINFSKLACIAICLTLLFALVSCANKPMVYYTEHHDGRDCFSNAVETYMIQFEDEKEYQRGLTTFNRVGYAKNENKLLIRLYDHNLWTEYDYTTEFEINKEDEVKITVYRLNSESGKKEVFKEVKRPHKFSMTIDRYPKRGNEGEMYVSLYIEYPHYVKRHFFDKKYIEYKCLRGNFVAYKMEEY